MLRHMRLARSVGRSEKLGRVFISYSHKDQDALELLRHFLDPLERAGRLTCWDDTRIATGDDWEARIDEALGKAGAAVLLDSQDVLASSFMGEKELPYLLGKHAQGRVRLLPVFLAPSNVRSTQPALAKIQGYGSPETENVLTWGERETLFKKLSERLLAVAGDGAIPKPRPSLPPSPPVVAPASSSAYDLTLALRREGADLVATYAQPGRDAFLRIRRPFEAVERVLAPIRRALDGGDTESICGGT